MAFYENTIVAKQDLADKEIKSIRNKYDEVIKNSSGKVIKIEEWGLLNLARKIKNYNKGFFIHYKFEGNKETLEEIEKKIKVDGSIIRHLTVKYKKLDIDNEYFNKSINEKKK
jgi:small subunit ribosomal protein S6